MTAEKLLVTYRKEMDKIKIKNGFTDEQMISYRQGFMDAIREYEQCKSTDVQPVRRGKWLEIAGYGGWSETYYQCPECNTTEYIPSNYCPNCGIELRGIDNG